MIKLMQCLLTFALSTFSSSASIFNRESYAAEDVLSILIHKLQEVELALAKIMAKQCRGHNLEA
jgi:hypothetical protein